MVSRHILQSLLLPEAGLWSEPTLYWRSEGGVACAGNGLTFAPGARVRFDTAMNLFNIGKWVSGADLSALTLSLRGSGDFDLEITQASAAIDPERGGARPSDMTQASRLARCVTLTDGGCADIPLPREAFASCGVLCLSLTARSDGARLDGADWMTSQAPIRQPDLMLSITTFRREEAAARTIDRFRSHLEARPQGRGRMRLTVVDNGGTLPPEAGDLVTVLHSRNLGGSGGFARGLLAARDTGASHCLFMDDDAAVHMEAFERTWAYLAYARDAKTAVAGGLADADEPWRVWENGARHDVYCRPNFPALDLTDAASAVAMECASTGSTSDKSYGGWWYFAFPLDAVAHDPFPFFLRRDDVAFSLANPFSITTLPGVIAHQDAGFVDKQGPLTLHFDLRGELAVITATGGKRRDVLRAMAGYVIRAVMAMAYDSARAELRAVEMYLAGPRAFVADMDAALTRAEVGALRAHEVWEPVAPRDPSRAARAAPASATSRWRLGAWVMSLGGLLVPFFGLLGRRKVLDVKDRWRMRAVLGAAHLTIIDAHTSQKMVLSHSKRAGLAILGRLLWLMGRVAVRYQRLRRDWRAGIFEMADEAFWRAQLDTPKPDDA